MDYVGKRMICDMDKADGNVLFEKEYFDFVPRSYNEKQYEQRIYYKDITNVRGYKGIKSTVCVDVNSTTYRFYMYKMNTFIELVESGRKNWNVVDAEVIKEAKQEPLSDAQLDKLAKLADLHKNGILTEDEFEKEKNLIINR